MHLGRFLIIALFALSLESCANRGVSTSEDSGISGRVHVGPTCPVKIANQTCADRPAVGSQVLTDAHGSFRVAAAPGRYVVTSNAGMSCAAITTDVSAHAYASLDVACDSGIR